MKNDTISKLIDKTGLSISQVATLFNVNPRTVRRWISGTSKTKPAQLITLSLIHEHGLSIITTNPHGLAFLVTMVDAMKDKGIVSIHRQLRCGYGVAARLIEESNNKENQP